MSEVENLYTNELESGDRTRAMQCLRLPPLEEKQPLTVTFRLGMFIGKLLVINSYLLIRLHSGMICLLIPILVILGIALFGQHSSKLINWRATFHLYRSSFLVVLHLIFFGINAYGWSRSGVNHVLIFEIDPRSHLTYQKYLELGAFLMAIWLISFNIFLVAFYLDFYPYIHPFAFVIFLVLFVINPLPIFYHKARWWLVKRLFRVFLAPFYPVEFADFWLGDQLCSLELVFFDMEFFFCFYINESNWSTSDPTHTFFCNGWAQICLQIFFLMLPSWFRFAQCLRRYRDTKQKFPHLVNAGKYASSFFVIISNALRRAKSFDYDQNKLENPFLYIWILTALISSTYKVFWDLKMDWGFFQKNSGKNPFLREQIIYSRKSYYYMTIVQNILFRYIWMLNIFVHFNTLFGEYSDMVGFVFGFIEVFRRFIWNYFRLENEHLNNCGGFRAVRDISIRPTPINSDPSNPEQPLRHESESSETNPSEDRTSTSVTMTTELTDNRSKSIPNLHSALRSPLGSIHS